MIVSMNTLHECALKGMLLQGLPVGLSGMLSP